MSELRKAIAQAIHDPGATEGYKGERSLTDWQTDAVMRTIAASPHFAVIAAAEVPCPSCDATGHDIYDGTLNCDGDGLADCTICNGQKYISVAELLALEAK